MLERTLRAIVTNPVRLYAVGAAILALVVHYVPTLPVGLILGVVAAILGGGEVTRSKVTPFRPLVRRYPYMNR